MTVEHPQEKAERPQKWGVLASGSFDDLRFPQMRFLEEASKLGRLHVALWDDAAAEMVTGMPPKFSLAERRYMLESVRYVDCVTVLAGPLEPDVLPSVPGLRPVFWAVQAQDDTAAKRVIARDLGLQYRVFDESDLAGFPTTPAGVIVNPGHKRVIVTGCYDWLHSGHVRFYEEVSQLGDLYVVVGHDANVRMLKGEGHPFFPQDLRRYMAGSIRFVTQALISSGMGWLDAEPEIARIRPHIYAVNEDGDKPEKRAFCEAHDIEYVVLRRAPKEGLPRRASTELRGY